MGSYISAGLEQTHSQIKREVIRTMEDQIALLDQKVSESGIAMLHFSFGIRSLFTVNQVTGTDDQTRIFREVRDTVRLNATIYKDKVLPVTQKAVNAISDYMAYFQDMEFEDWADCVGDIVEDIERGIGFCKYLKELHSVIIVDLKKSEDKVEVGQQMMEASALQQEENARRLRKEAKHAQDAAEIAQLWGTVFASLWAPLAGPAIFINHIIAKPHEHKAEFANSQAVAEAKNADLGRRAAAVTKNTIVPSIKNFLDGITACHTFLVATQQSLEQMQKYGTKDAKIAYYKAMKSKAGLIQATNTKFLTMMDHMRTNLAAVQNEPGDKNYVDSWLEEQNTKFKEQHKSIWDHIMVDIKRMI